MYIFTQIPEAAASSTNKVTKKKPWAQSPPGILTRSSKLLQIKWRIIAFTTNYKKLNFKFKFNMKNTLTQWQMAFLRRRNGDNGTQEVLAYVYRTDG